LRTEYKKLAVKEYDVQFRMSDDVYIDGEAMDEIFSKFKTPE
jgi:glutathione peroxidase-family protein